MNNSIKSLELVKIIFFSIIISSLIVIISLPDIPNTGGDAHHYIKAAEKGPYGVIRPHGTRFLLPFIVRIMEPLMNIHKGFFVMGTVSLLFFILSILFLLKLYNVPIIFSSIILFNPLIINYYIHYYIPDMLFMALISGYFIMIYYDRQYFASILLILLFLTRETIVILSIAVIIVSIFYKKRDQLILTIAGSIIGLLGISAIKHYTGSINIWGLPEFIYLILKIPFTMLKNLGIGIYTNISPYCDPIFTITLSEQHHIGKITTLGLCRWDPLDPIEMCLFFLTPFGIGPIYLYYILRNKLYNVFIKTNIFSIVFCYGLIIYILGFIISVDRLRVIGYGWPLFWLIIPIWLFTQDRIKKLSNQKKLLLIHCTICWTLFIIIKAYSWFRNDYRFLLICLTIIAINIILYCISWKIINKSYRIAPLKF